MFDEAMRRLASTPKVGLMKLVPVPGEEKYAVAIKNKSGLWLTTWVRCSRKGEYFLMIPRGDRDWDPHTSYHLDGTLHSKSYGKVITPIPKRQRLGGTFKGSEHLGLYGGHGTGSGAVCDPSVFDGVVKVGPDVLRLRNADVGVDLVEAGYEATWEHDTAPRFYLGDVVHRRVFKRAPRPSLIITIQRQVEPSRHTEG